MVATKLEDMVKKDTVREWQLSIDADAALEQVRRVVKDFRRRVKGDTEARMGGIAVRDGREYKLSVGVEEFIDLDEDGRPHFAPITPGMEDRGQDSHDAEVAIYRISDTDCTLLVSVRAKGEKGEAWPNYWQSFLEALDRRLKEVEAVKSSDGKGIGFL